jgi:hypothetical protein
MKLRLPRRLGGRIAPVAFLALASGLAACNAIFGIEPGQPTGPAGAGGATSSAASTSGTGGAAATTSGAATGGAASTASSGSTGGAGGSMPCGGNALDGHKASWVSHVGSDISNNVAMARTADGSGIVVAGSFDDMDTNFKLDPLPYPTPDGGYEGDDLFIAEYDATTGVAQWAKAFSGPSDQEVVTMAIDAAGDIFIGGYFQGSIAFSETVNISAQAGSHDGFVAKLDPMGNAIWAVALGTPGDDEVAQIALDAQGDVVIAGVTNGAQNGTSSATGDFGCGAVTVEGMPMVFVSKLDPGGAKVWCNLYPVNNGFENYSNPASGLAVTVAPGGQIVLAGGYSGDYPTTSFGQGQLEMFGESDVFVFVSDAGGNYLWAKGYGDENTQWVTQVAVDACGDIVLGGGFNTSVTFDGVSQTAAVDSTPGSAYYHMFLAKLTAPAPSQAAVGQWIQAYVDYGTQTPLGLVLDTAGDVTLTGTLEDVASSMGVAFGNGITLAASLTPYTTNSYHPNVFVAKIDGAGTARWALRYSGPQGETGSAVTADDQGHTWVAGTFEDKLNFGTGPITPLNDDLFVLSLGP